MIGGSLLERNPIERGSVTRCSFLIKYSIRCQGETSLSLPPYSRILLGLLVGSLTNPAANPFLGHLRYLTLLAQDQITRIKVSPHPKHSLCCLLSLPGHVLSHFVSIPSLNSKTVAGFKLHQGL